MFLTANVCCRTENTVVKWKAEYESKEPKNDTSENLHNDWIAKD